MVLSINSLWGRVHARRAMQKLRTRTGLWRGYYQAKVPKEALLFRDEKKKERRWYTIDTHSPTTDSTSSNSVRWLDILAFTYYLRSQCITNIQRMQQKYMYLSHTRGLCSLSCLLGLHGNGRPNIVQCHDVKGQLCKSLLVLNRLKELPTFDIVYVR